MEESNEKSNLQPDRDIFGFEKPVIPAGEVIIQKEKPALDVDYAGLGVRCLAYVLDAVILFGPLYYIEMAILAESHNSAETIYLQWFIDWFGWTAYYAIMESSRFQATVGKLVFNLKVIDEYGERLTIQRAALRYLTQIISIVPLGFGIWAISRHPKKQAWHDFLTGCFVIEINKHKEAEQ